MQVYRVVLWTTSAIAMSEIKDKQQNVQECVIFQYFA